jgi:hypothetical protein
MPTWNEAAQAYKEDLVSHYEIGKNIGTVSGALQAYSDVIGSMSEYGTVESLKDYVLTQIDKYEEMLEEITND